MADDEPGRDSMITPVPVPVPVTVAQAATDAELVGLARTG